MTRTSEDGRKAQCPGCSHPIKHLESSQVVDDGVDIWHADCFKMKYGEQSAMTDREMREIRVRKWANFDKLPKNQYGARRIA